MAGRTLTKEEERRQKENVEKEAKKVLCAAVTELYKVLPVEKIAAILGVSKEVVEQIINNR